MPATGSYMAIANRRTISGTTPRPVLWGSLTASDNVAEFTRFVANQAGSLTPYQVCVAVGQPASQSTTGGTSIGVILMQEGLKATGMTSSYRDSTTGTAHTNVWHEEAFNQLGPGMLWMPAPEERPMIGESSYYSMLMHVLPTDGDWTTSARWIEYTN